METKKFKLLKFTEIQKNCRTIYRIQALKDFSDVRKGDLGGWVESEDNLSQEGNCWIYDNACVCDNAKVRDNACVRDNAKVYGKSLIGGYANIIDNAKIFDNAFIQDYAKVCNNAILTGYTCLSGHSCVCDNVRLFGDVDLTDYAKICDNVCVFGNITARENVVICKNVEIRNNAIFLGDAKISSQRDYYSGCEIFNGGYPFTYTRSNNKWENIHAYGTREEFLKTLKEIVPYKVPFYIKVMDFVEDLLNDSNCITHQA